jgi:hypothetical protein
MNVWMDQELFLCGRSLAIGRVIGSEIKMKATHHNFFGHDGLLKVGRCLVN